MGQNERSPRKQKGSKQTTPVDQKELPIEENWMRTSNSKWRGYIWYSKPSIFSKYYDFLFC